MPSTKITKSVNYLLRIIIIIATYGFLYREIFVKGDIVKSWNDLSARFDDRNFLVQIIVIFLLMTVNWGLESTKWKLLISHVEKISWLKSYQAVLTGISISSFTPNRTGEYFGRVFMLDKANHIEGILINIIGSFSQLIVTIALGLFCSLYYVPNFVDVPPDVYPYVYFGMILIVPILIFFILLFYFNVGVLTPVLKKLLPRRWQRWGSYFEAFETFPKRKLLPVLLYSLARYLVFSMQFYWLLWLFGVHMPFIPGLMVISVVYLVMTAIPTIALAELGIRGSVSILLITRFLTYYGGGPDEPSLAIFTASSLIWFINLIIPAVLGTFFVFRLKFIRK
jgi:hypothetical protein